MLKVKPESSLSLSTPEFMEEEEDAPEEEEQTPRSPFWIQANDLGRLQRLTSLFFNSFVLIIFLFLLALLSLVFIIPSIHLSSNFLKPNLVKRSWDSINLILVLIALLFGFLSRTINNDENEKPNFVYDRSDTEVPAGAPITYDFQDQDTRSSIGLRRQRTSISYPDLRELSPPWNHRGAADPWRFSDDTHFNYYNVLDSNRNSFRQRSRRENNLHTPGKEEGLYFPPPQPPPQTPVKQKTKKVHRKFSTDDGERGNILSPETVSSEKRRARSSEPKRKLLLSPGIDPYPDPTLVQPVSPLTERNKEVDDNVSKEIFSSFYHKKKKKRQRDRSVDNLKTLLHHSQPLPVKKYISVTLPPPPPPPPQPARATITRVAPFVTDKPRTMTGFNINGIEDSSSGGESPMKNIPPPPPLPPFKIPDWKFAVEGDFVRLQGMVSDRSVSPDGDEARSPSSDVDTVATEMAVFSLSPDVDTKADSFIARFRAGLKLERMSKLGPGPVSGPSNY